MKLKKCHYCGSEATQTIHPDINIIGEKGYKSTIRCILCHNKIECWAKTYEEAQKKSIYYWNGEEKNE